MPYFWGTSEVRPTDKQLSEYVRLFNLYVWNVKDQNEPEKEKQWIRRLSISLFFLAVFGISECWSLLSVLLKGGKRINNFLTSRWCGNIKPAPAAFFMVHLDYRFLVRVHGH